MSAVETKPPLPRSRPIDVHIGSRLRLRRTLMGMSQEKLADAVNLTFQQIQKYEKGANRIGASRLYQFSKILDVPPSYFFDSMPDNLIDNNPTHPSADGSSPGLRDPLTKRETLELVRAYYRVSDPAVRKRVFELVKSLAEPTVESETGSIPAEIHAAE